MYFDEEYEEDYKRNAIPSVVRKVIANGGPIHTTSKSEDESELENASTVIEIPTPGSTETGSMVQNWGLISPEPSPTSIPPKTTEQMRPAPGLVSTGTTTILGKEKEPLFKDIRQTTLRLLKESVNSDTLTEREKVALLSEICTFTTTILKERFDVEL